MILHVYALSLGGDLAAEDQICLLSLPLEIKLCTLISSKMLSHAVQEVLTLRFWICTVQTCFLKCEYFLNTRIL